MVLFAAESMWHPINKFSIWKQIRIMISVNKRVNNYFMEKVSEPNGNSGQIKMSIYSTQCHFHQLIFSKFMGGATKFPWNFHLVKGFRSKVENLFLHGTNLFPSCRVTRRTKESSFWFGKFDSGVQIMYSSLCTFNYVNNNYEMNWKYTYITSVAVSVI